MKNAIFAFFLLTNKLALCMDAPCYLTSLPIDITLPLVQKLGSQDRIQLFSACRTLNNFGMEIYYAKTANQKLRTVIWNQINFQSDGELLRFNLIIVKLVSAFQKFCHCGRATNSESTEQIKQLSHYLAKKVDHINPQSNLIIGAPEYYWHEEYNHTSLHLILRWLQSYANAQIKAVGMLGEIESDHGSYALIQEYIFLMRRYLFENNTDIRLHNAELDLYASLFLYWQPLKNALDRKSTGIRWTVRCETTSLLQVDVIFVNLDTAFMPSVLYEDIINKNFVSSRSPNWVFDCLLLKDIFDITNETESDSEYEYLSDGTVKKICQGAVDIEQEDF